MILVINIEKIYTFIVSFINITNFDTDLPFLVMIISVPNLWNSFQRSAFNNSASQSNVGKRDTSVNNNLVIKLSKMK